MAKSRYYVLPIGAGVIGQDDVPLVRIMDSDETPTTITVYGVVDTVQPVTSVTWTVNGVEQTGDVSRSPVLELTDLQPETSYAITLRATNINGDSSASARTITTKKITTVTPASVLDGVSYYNLDVYYEGTIPTKDENDIVVSGRDVTVPTGYYAENETVSVSSDYIIPAGTKNINTNGTEDVTQYANVNVNVPASAVVSGTKNITNNGTEDVTNYANVNVQVPASAVDVGTLTLPAITQNVTLFTQDVTGYRAVAFPVAVPASEVDTGTKQITSNGNGQDVVGYAAVDVNVQPNLTTLPVTPQTSPQTIVPSGNVDGYNQVTVSAVTGAIDPNITAGNIKNGVTILGVQGTYDPQPNLGSLYATHNETYNASEDGYDGYNIVTVDIRTHLYTSPSVTPSTSQQTVSIPSGYDGLDAVTVDGVTSAIDANIQAGNIKDGVTILGVTGTFDPTPNLGTLQVTPSTNAQTITPSGSDGWDEVNVDAVTSAIDANITAGNIKNGVSILGVQGTLEGGTPQNLTFTFADGTSGTYTFYAS